jgi:ketosteroid isomerase-like protein
MSGRGDETVRVLRTAVHRSDLSMVEELLADDVRWFGNFPAGACHNREQVLATLQAQLERGVHPRLEDVQAQGDRVLLQVGLSSEAESTEPESRLWFALTVGDTGRITELQDYSTSQAAERDIALRARGAAGGPSPASPVYEMVPFVQVTEVHRSVAFYRLLGLDLRDTYEYDGHLVWASMAHASAALMLAQSEAPIDPRAQGVLFYLHAVDLDGLRDHLVAHGLTTGEIVDGSPGPKREMRVTDPDGYCLMVAEIEH